jgi:glycosyltransferase involved in cell wall biosynthesis
VKVLVIEPCFVNFGGYFRAHGLSLALSKKGVKVDLLVSNNKNFFFKIKKTKVNDNFNMFELPRIKFHPYVNGRILRGLIALFFGAFGKYDVIHACVSAQLESNIPAFFLKLSRKKVLMDWDDYWMGSPIFTGHDLIKKYIKFCEKNAPRFFENMVVVSDFLEDLANKWGAKNVLKLVNGVDIDQFRIRNREESLKKLGLEKDKKYLLCIGNTYYGDRVLYLLKAFEKIYNFDPKIALICNFNPLEKIKERGLKGEIDEKSLENIIGMGYLSNEDLERCFGVCDATIFLQGKTEDELACFPIRIGSYLSAEMVIVMNDTGSEAAKTLQKYSCAIVEKDSSILAQKTVELLNNQGLQMEMKKKVIFAKNDLSWDNQIKGLITFYDKIN